MARHDIDCWRTAANQGPQPSNRIHTEMSRYTEFEKAAVQRAKDAAGSRTSTLGLIALLRKTVVADLKRAARRAAIVRELGELDARTLADIGVDPSGIDALADQIV